MVPPRFSILPVLYNNDKSNITVLIDRQPQLNEYVDSHKIISFIQTGSTVAIQREDGRLCIHGSTVVHGAEDHHARNYKIRVTKM